MLTMNPEKVCYIIVKARQFDVKEESSELNEGGNPSGDRFFEVLETQPDDPALEELVGALKSLNRDELHELAALTWIGRGDFGKEQMSEARRTASGMEDDRLIRELVTIPLLGDYLEEGLSAFGESCLEFEAGRL